MLVSYAMFISLIVTILIELVVALVICIRDKKDLINIILVNVLTNPLLVSSSYLIFLKFGESIVFVYEFMMEIVIFLVEGIIYNKYLKYRKINSYVVACILNLFSYFVGSCIIDKII